MDKSSPEVHKVESKVGDLGRYTALQRVLAHMVRAFQFHLVHFEHPKGDCARSRCAELVGAARVAGKIPRQVGHDQKDGQDRTKGE